jgi:hypothetical protein
MDENRTTMIRQAMLGTKVEQRIILTCSLGEKVSKRQKVRKAVVRMRKL